MKTLFGSVVGLVMIGVTAHAAAPITYAQIESEIGCNGRATDIQKERLFKEQYHNLWVTWTGTVHDVRSGALWLKTIGSRSIGSDFDVDMSPEVDLFQFNKGQRVTVKFQIKNYMGCFLPLRGSNGTIVSG